LQKDTVEHHKDFQKQVKSVEKTVQKFGSPNDLITREELIHFVHEQNAQIQLLTQRMVSLEARQEDHTISNKVQTMPDYSLTSGQAPNNCSNNSSDSLGHTLPEYILHEFQTKFSALTQCVSVYGEA
jgi:hypothetical protein